jgi:hypothetical protein
MLIDINLLIDELKDLFPILKEKIYPFFLDNYLLLQ